MSDDETYTLTMRNLETGQVEEITMAAGSMVQVAVCSDCRRPLEFGECWNCHPQGDTHE